MTGTRVFFEKDIKILKFLIFLSFSISSFSHNFIFFRFLSSRRITEHKKFDTKLTNAKKIKIIKTKPKSAINHKKRLGEWHLRIFFINFLRLSRILYGVVFVVCWLVLVRWFGIRLGMIDVWLFLHAKFENMGCEMKLFSSIIDRLMKWSQSQGFVAYFSKVHLLSGPSRFCPNRSTVNKVLAQWLDLSLGCDSSIRCVSAWICMCFSWL